MTDLLTAAKQALEALERIDAWLNDRHLSGLMPQEKEVVTALRSAIEAAERAEPDMPTWAHQQDWKGVDGAVAFHLIERHADNWADIRTMMDEWLAANAPAQEKQEPVGTLLNPKDHKFQRDNFWVSEEDGKRLAALPSGTKLYTAAPTIPAGMCLVPLEPTEEMISAGHEQFADATGGSLRDAFEINNDMFHTIEIYKAMIDAAQK